MDSLSKPMSKTIIGYLIKRIDENFEYICIMMSDLSDDINDLIKYYKIMNEKDIDADPLIVTANAPSNLNENSTYSELLKVCQPFIVKKAFLLYKKKNKLLLTVCENGINSSKAATLLRKAGFENAFSLKGGLRQWRTDNMTLVK